LILKTYEKAYQDESDYLCEPRKQACPAIGYEPCRMEPAEGDPHAAGPVPQFNPALVKDVGGSFNDAGWGVKGSPLPVFGILFVFQKPWQVD
jgi:hypothetical protein